MDSLTFVAKVLEVIAWPVSIIILVTTLRAEILKLLPFLRKLKAGPIEAEFEKSLNQIQELVDVETNGSKTQPNAAPSKPLLLELADLHPRSAILEAWVRIEAASNLAIQRHLEKLHGPGALSTRMPNNTLLETLQRYDILPAPQIRLLHELRSLRNDVAHTAEFNPSKDSAVRYIDVASRIQWMLEEFSK